MNFKNILTKEFLEKNYLEYKMSCGEIADSLNLFYYFLKHSYMFGGIK